MAKSASSAVAMEARSPGCGVANQLDASERIGGAWEEFAGDGFVHDQRFRRVAHRRPLRLGVHQNRQRHVEVGAFIDVDVAIAVAVDDVGNGGVLEHGFDE